MAYSTDNPPALVSQGVGGKFRQWMYDSADPATDVRVDGYITNGVELGMTVGDMLIHVDETGATVAHIYTVVAVNADGSVNLSDGTEVDVTDTD